MDHNPDRDSQTVHIAVVGAGPAGIYTCEALLGWADDSGIDLRINVIERLPVPFGLLRYGVAPDHPRIKGIARVLRGILEDPRIAFFGGVEVGAPGSENPTHVSIDEVLERHNAVILTTGALTDRRLEIPGSDSADVHGAAEFVTWYDGHPDAASDWPLTAERVAVIGVGNVALDVARMLLRTPAELESTDVPEAVHEAFGQNAARVVTVLGRRGPWQAKFTALELRELDKLDGVRVIVDPADLEAGADDVELRSSDRRVDKNLTQLEAWAEQSGPDPDYTASQALDGGERVLRFRFFATPDEVVSTDGHVVALRTKRTGGDRVDEFPVDAVYTAVGYRSTEIVGIPFDGERAVIPNDAGRVLVGTAAAGEPPVQVPGLYAAGWVKRGPTGVIGTNRSCAVETVTSLIADVDSGEYGHTPNPDVSSLGELLAERGVEVVDMAGRLAIEAHEEQLGAAAGRERTKLTSRAEMLEIAAASRAGQGLPVAD